VASSRYFDSAWTPWLFNVAVAATLRLLLPIDLTPRGERYTYHWMTGMFPYPECSALHCFRFLSPLFTWLSPTGTIDAFIAIGFIFQALAGVAMWHLAARLSGSNRMAFVATLWYWTSWNPIFVFTDPLLITDPVQAFWSLATLYLLLTERHRLALAMLVCGAAVKETVPLVAFIYSGYVLLTAASPRRRLARLAVLTVVPTATWLALRLFLHSRYGYSVTNDLVYGPQTYLFGIWLQGRSPHLAALYFFGSFGAGWVLGAAGLAFSNREQRAIAAASVPAMLLLSLYQTPDRALASFPYAVLIPAAMFLVRLPRPLAAAVLIANAAFTMRMIAAPTWLPRINGLLAVLFALVVAGLWIGWTRRRSLAAPRADEATRPGDPRRLDPIALTSWIVLTASAIVIMMALKESAPTIVAALTPPAGVAVTDDDASTPALAISPDERHLAFVGRDTVSSRLWIEPLPSGTALEVAGTDGASAPFWSPDGRRIGFFAAGKLKTVDLQTKNLDVIADAPVPRGGAWGADDVIIFAPTADSALYRVPARGGAPTPLTTLDTARGQRSHRWPSFLPDGRRFLFSASGSTVNEATLHLGSLSGMHPIHLRDHVYNAVYVPGFVLYGRDDGVLMLQPFDLRRNAILGEAKGKRKAGYSLASQRAAFSATAGTLVFAAATANSISGLATPERQWLDRRGRPIVPSPLDRLDAGRAVPAPEPGGFEAERSPDGQWIAYTFTVDYRPEIFVQAAASPGTRWQVSSEGGIHPHWRGDGGELFFVSGTRFIMAAPIATSSGFSAGAPHPLFAVNFAADDVNRTRTDFAVTADGRRFLLHQSAELRSAPVVVMHHWLPALAP
jgi:hypothetical protein